MRADVPLGASHGLNRRRPRAVYGPTDVPTGAWTAPTPAKNDGVLAVLGPTNTGKTHYAIERMLGHQSGVIGFPLRLLAREVYDRVVALRGPGHVALITGEEKILPPDARYFLCTVESMPLDWGADFVAVDEIQLCADGERGHIFTNRLLSARGRHETLFLGAVSMKARLEAVLPGVRFVFRERLSTLSYAGSKKISRLPARSAIVGFSVDNVYAIAELIRRQKGGAAVVMGALSPRTRNAQVALYQEGDVDYLVATDAIGMGLNLDVRHVAFSGLAKFDGRRHRRLEPQELAQIAGRAGRHMNDGTFGVTGEAGPIDEDTVEAIESHRFAPVGRLQWRNAALETGSPEALLASLEKDPRSEHLCRAREADDVAVLRALSKDGEIRDRARSPGRVKLLWEVCQIPDFRKTLPAEHAALLGQIYRHLSDEVGALPEDWIAAQCARLDRTDGDIDALSKRLAYIRTWTYVANRARWLRDPTHWRETTRAIEDRLSDALHGRLTQRFVDRRTSVLARRLKQKERLVASVDDKGEVTVEGEFVGRIEGFRFQADPNAAGAEVKTLQAAGAQSLQSEFAKRVNTFYNAPDAEIALTEQGGFMWGDAAVGRLAPKGGAEGGDPLNVEAVPFSDDMIEPPLVEKIQRRLQFWIDRKIQTVFEPLFKLREDPAVAGLARGVSFQLIERLGVIPRPEIADDIKALDQDARRPLRAHQVRFGQHTVFIPALLKPAATRLRLILWGLSEKLDEIPSPPPPGHVTIPTDAETPRRAYAMAGYHPAGARAIRIDMLERLADMIRPMDARAGFEATPEMLSITGATLEQFADMMTGLGYRAERGERPKTPKALAVEGSDVASASAAPPTDAAAMISPDESTPSTSDAPSPETTEASPPTPQAASPESESPTLLDDARQETAEEAPPLNAPTTTLTAATVEAAAPRAEAPIEESASPQDAAEGGARDGAQAAAAAADPTQLSGDTAVETPAAAAAANSADDAAEKELFYVFKSAPRGRRQRDDARAPGEGGPRRGRRKAPDDGAGATGRSDGAGPSSGDKQAPGGRGRGKGGKSGKGKLATEARPRKGGERFEAGPGGGDKRGSGPKSRRERQIDPDSPFAILQKLKERE